MEMLTGKVCKDPILSVNIEPNLISIPKAANVISQSASGPAAVSAEGSEAHTAVPV